MARYLAAAAFVVLLIASLGFSLPVASAAEPPEMDAKTGDANCSGDIDAVDAAVVLQFDAGLFEALPCAISADVDCNMVVDAIDASLILQYDAALILNLPM